MSGPYTAEGEVAGKGVGVHGQRPGGLRKFIQVTDDGFLRVDVASGSASGTEYATDDAAPAAPEGPTFLAIRDDALSTLAQAEGDWVPPRVNSLGALHVTGGGGGTEYSEDNVAPSPVVGGAILAVRDDALGGVTPIEGDFVPLYSDANGALWARINGTVLVDGSANTQPISGTVTANLSAVDNAVLDTIDAVLDAINAKLVSGTVIGDVNLGAVDNAVLDAIAASAAAIETATETLDDAISGSEMQVDVVSAPDVTVGDTTIDDYETVAASQTDQVLGPTGATGDLLTGFTVIPATTSPGAVSIKDGAGSAITIFTGGADSVGSLVPFFIPWPAKSTAGAWSVTTGTNVSVAAFGKFT